MYRQVPRNGRLFSIPHTYDTETWTPIFFQSKFFDPGMAGREGTSGGFIRRNVQGALKMEDSKYITLTLYIKHFVSELFGTGLLVFLGCMGLQTQPHDHLGVCLSFGVAAFIAIQICCHNSGGHINPSLTVISIFFNKVSIPMAINYILGQCVGATLGYGLLMAVTPVPREKLCVTVPHEDLTDFQAIIFEGAMTAILMLCVCSIWDPRNGTLLDSATLKFGFTIFSLAYAGVSYTGCSMNPARSFGPALWNNSWTKHWVYWVGPIGGSVIAALVYKTFFCGPMPKKVETKENLKLEIDSTTHC